MSRDLQVGLTLRLRDEASQPAQQSERNIQRGLQQTARTYADASRVAVSASRQSADARMAHSAQADQTLQQAERNVQRGIQQTAHTYADASRAAVSASRMLTNARMSHSARAEQAVQRNVAQTDAAYLRSNRNVLMASQRLADARQVLDVRSEQAIRREIDQTVAAYNRLERAGFSSAGEQARAFAVLQKKVGELNQELGKTVEKQGLLARGASGLSRVGGVAVGAYAGAHVLSGPVERTMQFDMALANMANSSYRNLAPEGRIKATEQLRKAVYRAVNEGGGTLEQATEALEKLLNHDALSHEAAFDLLPKLQRGAIAENADPVELGNIAVRAVQNLRFDEKDSGRVLDMAAAGTHTGEFKIKDLSHYLPSQMGEAANAGLSGPRGLAKIIALDEAAMATAGTPGQAATNVGDLLSQLSGLHFRNAAKRAGIKNFDEVRMKTLARGGDAVDAALAMVDTVLKNNKQYQKVKHRMEHAPSGQQKEIAQDMEKLLRGSAIGQLFGNQQAILALTAAMTQKEKMKVAYDAVMKEYNERTGVIDQDYKVNSSQDGFKMQLAKTQIEIGEMEALRGLNHQLGDAAGKLADYAKEYPGLTKAIAGTTLAFESLGGVIAGLGVARLLTGPRQLPPNAVVPVGGPAGAVGAEAGAAGALSAGARFIGGLVKVGAPIAAIEAMIDAFNIYKDDSKTPDEKKAGYVGAVGGGVGGALAGVGAGMATGAALGSVFPVAGNIVGAGVGAVAGLLGHEFGTEIGKLIGDAIFAQKKDEKPPVVESHVTLNLDGQHLFDFVTTSGQKAALRY
ncbi:phage tail tape measure protein [Burkholderia cepacia]|uniref:phage tail tape measure protein n=1 Tax=Burkholderia cepacia TaxID=292 RepID=UPI000759EC93|nr:phage tail tape measure protein [Burkholderia cepacia]KWH56299.1 tail tape measure protein [Burkholderia cepacia]